MHSVVQPSAWVVLSLPSGLSRVLQAQPNTTISLGKYGSFPSNLIIHRPYHLTYELQDRQNGENFSRLRIVPPVELYADIIAEEAASDSATPADDGDQILSATDEVEFSLVDPDSGEIVARSNHEIIDDSARQTLTPQEIEALKLEGTNAGKDIIAKLLLSHTAIDRKTNFSLAKYKLLKTKKYIRRFQVLPLDVPIIADYFLEQRDHLKIMEMRAEMIGLLGCWGNVHYGGDNVFSDQPSAVDSDESEDMASSQAPGNGAGRWLAVDDTSGLLVAALAERMGILYPEEPEVGAQPGKDQQQTSSTSLPVEESRDTEPTSASNVGERQRLPRQPRPDDFSIPYSQTNTITIIHSQSQPNLSLLTHYDFNINDPNPRPHPLATNLLPISWLQLLNPSADTGYSMAVPSASAEEIASWKPARRGNYHRKRRRYARTKHIVDTTRAGGFSGLVCASTMDPISVLRHTLPLLSGGAPVALYSPSLEPLAQAADCFSVARRSAWVGTSLPAEAEGKSVEELERWSGNAEFPLNPTLLLGVSIQTSRARRWQVLPGRTHPVMTSRGGSEGYVLTGWRARPVDGKIDGRGKFMKKRKIDADVSANLEAEILDE